MKDCILCGSESLVKHNHRERDSDQPVHLVREHPTLNKKLNFTIIANPNPNPLWLRVLSLRERLLSLRIRVPCESESSGARFRPTCSSRELLLPLARFLTETKKSKIALLVNQSLRERDSDQPVHPVKCCSPETNIRILVEIN